MKKLFNESPVFRFATLGLILPALSLFISVVQEIGRNSGGNPFSNPLFFFLSVIHVFGISNMVLYAVIANDKLFRAAGLKLVLPVCIVTTLASSLISYLVSPVLRVDGWIMNYFSHALKFSVLPGVLTIVIKYGFWRNKQRGQSEE